MSSLADAALVNLREGFPIFPVDRAKKPLVKWEAYQQRLPTEDQLKRWWQRWPDANIGMATGRISRLVVVDCDSEEATRRFVDTYPEVHDTCKAQTGRGTHFYFGFEGGIRNSSGLLGPEIDVRGEGGFVVLPPSIHSNGQPYRWLNEADTLPLPGKLKNALAGASKQSGKQEHFREDEKIKEGRRNVTLTSLGGSLRQRGLDADTIYVALAAVNHLRCDPPLARPEVEKIAFSVARYEPVQEAEVVAETPNSESLKASLITPDVSDGSGLIWAKDVPPPGEGEEIETLWGPFLYPSSLHLLSGDAGLAKTTVAYNVAISLVRGDPFAGYSPPRPLKVLYYDLETPEALFREKLHRISDNDPPDGLAFCRSFSIAGVIPLAKQYSFDLIVIDTLNEAFETRDEKDNAEANRQMRQLRKIINETGAAILAFSHMAQEPGAKEVYKFRGATARPAAADIVLNLEPNGLKPSKSGQMVEAVRLQVAKNRWTGDKPSLCLLKIGQDRFDVAESHRNETATQETQVEALILDALPYEPEAMETKEILRAVRAKGYSRPTIERALGHLTNAAAIHRPRKGVYCRPRTHPSHQGYRDDGLRDEGNGEAEAQRPTPEEWREADRHLWPTTWI